MSNSYDEATLVQRLEDIQERIDEALSRSDVDQDVTLVAVSKTHPTEAMEVLYAQGLRDFGESYVQEWEDKYDALPADIRWHFVGRLQSNKAKYLADKVHRVHSIDRKSVTKKLARRSSGMESVFLQVNLADQDSKGGVAPEKLHDLYDLVTHYGNLEVVGLMGMPPYADDPEDNRPHFRHLRELMISLQDYVADAYPDRRQVLRELSMGMSNDFEVAIEEGATVIRVGTALFGERNYDG